jgi:Mitochondrial 28S ribosomal protein S30 (PDCD9)
MICLLFLVNGFNDLFIVYLGHWIGDPCEYCLLSLHVMPTSKCRQLRTLGAEFTKDAQLAFGMTASFGSCVAQAHNQGMS